MLRATLIMAVIAVALAQSPGNGISKTTYAANDPVPAKEWMYKYFPVGTPGDECTDDICTCPAGTGGSTEWYIQQGRVYTLESLDSGRKLLQSAGQGFGIHTVNVSNHLTTGGLSVAEVEAHFTDKFTDMATRFDSFLDFNAFFYTTALADYVTAFKADGVPMYTTTWTYSSKTYTSVFVHNPNTQVVIEICQDTTLDAGLLEGMKVHTSERRASIRAIESIEIMKTNSTVEAGNAILTPLAVNRGVSAATLAKLDAFYLGVGTTKSDTLAENGVTKYCYLWTGATVDVCFYNRADTETKGDFKIGDFEDMLNKVHENMLTGYPLCVADKWTDNHYAIDSFTADTATIVNYVDDNKILHVCESSPMTGSTTMHYMIDPTGWGIQMDMNFKTAPSDCSTDNTATVFPMDSGRKLLQSHTNPACDPGTCA